MSNIPIVQCSLKPSWVARRQGWMKLCDAGDGLRNRKITLFKPTVGTLRCVSTTASSEGSGKNTPESGDQHQSPQCPTDDCLCPGPSAERSGTGGKGVATLSVQFKPKLIKMFLCIMFPADVGSTSRQTSLNSHSRSEPSSAPHVPPKQAGEVRNNTAHGRFSEKQHYSY